METSLKTGFAQIFSCCPKNLSCPNFGGAAAPLAPRGPYAYGASGPLTKKIRKTLRSLFALLQIWPTNFAQLCG